MDVSPRILFDFGIIPNFLRTSIGNHGGNSEFFSTASERTRRRIARRSRNQDDVNTKSRRHEDHKENQPQRAQRTQRNDDDENSRGCTRMHADFLGEYVVKKNNILRDCSAETTTLNTKDTKSAKDHEGREKSEGGK
jgi:hypothetical protein